MLHLKIQNNDTAEKEARLSVTKSADDILAEKIKHFQSSPFVKNINLENAAITKDEWLELIQRFEKQKRHKITPVFFIGALSSIRKTNFETIRALISKTQPARDTKQNPPTQEVTAPRKNRNRVTDEGVNALIVEANDDNPALRAKLENSGVRFTTLTPTTPVKGQAPAFLTPGGTSTRFFGSITRGGSSTTFFKHKTPLSKKPLEGRVDLSQATQENVLQQHPKLTWERVGPISFTATPLSVAERTGTTRRQDQKSLTKVSASDIFRAHGIQIATNQGHKHHWAHLIGYCLGGEQDQVNLVPTTAAANYNTLEAIELYIKDKLESGHTPQIIIEVEPQYTGEASIPDVLVYTLSWQEQRPSGQLEDCDETFYISPQSYERITPSMRKSIAIAREGDEENQQPGLVPTN